MVKRSGAAAAARGDAREGRAGACQRRARPETGLRGAVMDMIAETREATPREWAALALVAALVLLCGLIEGSTWPM